MNMKLVHIIDFLGTIFYSTPIKLPSIFYYNRENMEYLKNLYRFRCIYNGYNHARVSRVKIGTRHIHHEYSRIPVPVKQIKSEINTMPSPVGVFCVSNADATKASTRDFHG